MKKATKRTQIAQKLSKLGIKSMTDLDGYIATHLCTGIDGKLYGESRYGMLKKLIGEADADKVMHELMVRSW